MLLIRSTAGEIRERARSSAGLVQDRAILSLGASVQITPLAVTYRRESGHFALIFFI
jgi:hypothetical protein